MNFIEIQGGKWTYVKFAAYDDAPVDDAAPAAVLADIGSTVAVEYETGKALVKTVGWHTVTVTTLMEATLGRAVVALATWTIGATDEEVMTARAEELELVGT